MLANTVNIRVRSRTRLGCHLVYALRDGCLATTHPASSPLRCLRQCRNGGVCSVMMECGIEQGHLLSRSDQCIQRRAVSVQLVIHGRLL